MQKKVATPAKKRLPPDLDRYCRKQFPIVIENNTECILMLSFTDTKGHDRVVKVPNGKAPFCVTDYVSHRLVADNNDFRRLIAERHVTLLNPKLVDMSKRAKAGSEFFTMNNDQDEENIDADLAIDQEVIDASPQVAFAVASVDTKNTSPRDFVNKMDAMTSVITDRDLIYVNNELGRKFPKLGEWATTKLAELKEEHPERCISKKAIGKRGPRPAEEIIAEAAEEDASDADIQAEASAKRGVAKQLKKTQEGIGQMGSAKEAAKKMLEAKQKERMRKRGTPAPSSY